jgi:hypothetical protein
VHEPRSDYRMPLKLDRKGFEEGVALLGMDRRGGLHDGAVFVIVEAQGMAKLRRTRRDLGRPSISLSPWSFSRRNES